MTDSNNDRFDGVTRLHCNDGFVKLQKAHICVVGVGGVGEITLIDVDDNCVTDINRKIHALTEIIGKEKVRKKVDSFIASFQNKQIIFSCGNE